jgi:hypothetical protein
MAILRRIAGILLQRVILIPLLLFLFFQYAYCLDFTLSGSAEYSVGADNDLDFDDNTNENTVYHAFRLKSKGKLSFYDKMLLAAEIQAIYTFGEKGEPYSTFNTDEDRTKLRKAYIKWMLHNSEVTIGLQRINLPGAAFDNPLFNGHIGALDIFSSLSENVNLDVFIAYPFQNDTRLPKASSAAIFGTVFDFIGDAFTISPYFLGAYINHQKNSVFDWASAPDDAHSYMLGGGAALTYYFTDKITLMLDFIKADTNNNGEHHFETKGYFSDILLEYYTIPVTLGLFGWYASGNSARLQEHFDYGLLPVIGAETGFSPVRLAFKGSEFIGRDSAISDTGVGTAGMGVHLKNFHTLEKLWHIFRAAYITGTSVQQGNGIPASVGVPSLAKERGEPGMMTGRDYVVEIDLDNYFEVTNNLTAALQLAYIFNGFRDKAYSADIYNIQFSLMFVF